MNTQSQISDTSTQTSATQSERPVDPRVERTAEAASHIVEAAVDVGRVWASYGLRVGKLALETHAVTMGKLAGALGQLNRAIGERRENDDAEPQSASAQSAQT